MYYYYLVSAGIMLFGAAVSLLKALEQITAQKPSRSNYFLFFLLLCTTYIQCSFAFFILNIAVRFAPSAFAFFFTLFVVNCYNVGPLSKFYYHHLIAPEAKMLAWEYVYFLPSALSAIIMGLYFYAMDPSEFDSYQFVFLNRLSHHPVITGILAGASLQVTLFWFFLLTVEFSVWNSEALKREVRFLVVVSIGWTLCPLLSITGYLSGEKLPLCIAGLILSMGHILFCLAYNRYHEFFQMLKSEIVEVRYKKSRLRNIDVTGTLEKLQGLMANDRLYRDFNITIDSIAARLSITPQQLSQLLNERLGTDFRNFINEFRIEETKSLLLAEEDADVLSICYAVGFGSKSAFNAAFKKFTGMTPITYKSSNSK